ncbi:MAG TPA: ABC transporter ATP-binding protein [Planctomycetota bacterium]|nr:ABC transporter ATP-binding protein [Planctomycetota bacterium]
MLFRHLKRLVPYLLKFRGRFVLGLLAVLLAAGAGMVSPLFVRRAIEELEKGARREFILNAALALVFFAVVRAIFVFIGRTVILVASRAVEFDLRNDLYQHLERLPPKWFDRNRSGDITSRLINDLEGVRMLAGMGIMALASTGLTFAFSMAGMCLIDLKLALIALVPLSLVTIVTAATGPAMHRLSLAVQDQLAVLSSRAQENFSGARVVKSFTQEDEEVARFRVECQEYRKRNLSLARFRGFAFAGMTLFMEVAIVVTLYFGGRGIVNGTFSKPDLAAFTTFQFQLVWPMIAIGWVFAMAQRGAACMGRLAEILDEPALNESEAHPSGPALKGGEASPSGPALKGGEASPSGRIEFRNLTFSYEAGRDPALRGVSFTIEPGSRVSVVGATGSGKSTIASLLLKLYEAPPGTLFVDGRDISALPTAPLRRALGAAPQDIFLFSDTLSANIAFGAVDEPDRARIETAAKLSRIAEDAVRFPDGLDQRIGERGVTLSGGQKQRVALARAAVRDPSIVVLDDALSSVDAHTEREVLESLRAFMKGRTSVLITHRMAVALDADRVIVLDAGQVVEQGTPAGLIARGGLFAAMVERQKLADALDAGGNGS